MSFSIVKPALKVGRRCRHLQRLAFWEGVIGMISTAALLHPSLWSLWLLPASGLLFLYSLRKCYVFFRMRRAARQVGLEQQFLRQHLDAKHLRECLYRRDHFWRKSLILSGLRKIAQCPLPRQFTPARKKRRLRGNFRDALHSLRLLRVNIDWMLYGAALGASAWQIPSSLYVTAGGVTIGVALLESWQAVLQWRLHRENETVVEVLGDWVLTQNLHKTLRTIGRSGYTHYPLYQTSSWLAG